MAVIDLRVTPTGEDTPDRCEVCVVGTGPAGATVAAELASTGIHVVILESGARERRDDVDELTAFENVGRARKEDPWMVRNRLLGGSSHTWGGRGAPFDEIDYEHRDWVPMSGWPFDHETLAPYLERSAPHLGLAFGDGFSDERFYEVAPRARHRHSADPRLIRPFFWQFSLDPKPSYPFEYRRFGRGVESRLGPTQTLVLGATALYVRPTDNGDGVESVVYATPDGTQKELRATAIVLCAGGIDNTRILLSSDTVVPEGLGNTHDQLGRYLMDHPRGSTALFPIEDAAVLRERLGRHNVRGHLFRTGFRLSPDVQRSERLVNAAAWLGEEIAEDDPWDALRWMIRGGRSRVGSLRAISRNLDLVALGIRDFFVRHTGVPRKYSRLRLDVMCEQVPDPESRITLSERTDRLGQRIPRIDWRSHPDEMRSVRRLTELVVEQFYETGMPVPVLEPWVATAQTLPEEWTDVAHPTGTTRMSERPEDGVVDPDGQVHGVDGLFVTGSSVFPTAGHCNPTQMIVALSVKTADAVRACVAAAASAGASSEAGDVRTVLVTGARGRIGRVAVAEFLARSYRVRAVASDATAHESAPAGLEWAVCDFETAADAEFDALVRGCDAVVHLAAALGSAHRMPRVNTDATRLLAQAAERAGIPAFCYVSTISVYGSPRARVADEHTPVLTVDRDVPGEYLALDYVRAYGRTKLAGELAIHDVAERGSYVIFRPTVVVDVDQLIEVRRWGRAKRYLAAHRTAHHVYVRDVADALVWAVERGLAGVGVPGGVEVFNLGEDGVARPRYAHFMADAFRASGDSRWRVVAVPGVVDWAQDLLRFRRLSARHPLWRARYPSSRLRRAGYRPRYGVAYARSLALQRLREERESTGRHG